MISVIIPTYNRAHTLLSSVASVLNQTLQDFELLIVDDGSTDDTAQSVAGLADNRIRYLRKENGGAASARNFGIAHAAGDYIAFQDSDDLWRPDKLEMQLRAMRRTDADVVFCRLERHNYAADRGATRVIPAEKAGFKTLERLVRVSIVSTQTIFAKRRVLLETPFDATLRKLEDYEWAIRAGEKHTFYLMDEPLVDVFLQSDSITRQGTDLQYMAEIFKRNEEMLKRHPAAYGYMLNYAGNYRRECHQTSWRFYGKAFLKAYHPKYLVKWALALARDRRVRRFSPRA